MIKIEKSPLSPGVGRESDRRLGRMHRLRRQAGAAMRAAAARTAEESAAAVVHDPAPHIAGWVTGDGGWLGNEDEEAFIEIAPILSPEHRRATERILKISTLTLIWVLAFT